MADYYLPMLPCTPPKISMFVRWQYEPPSNAGYVWAESTLQISQCDMQLLYRVGTETQK